MTKQQTDILISGGGIAGLTAAASFGAAGFSVVCVDPAPPVTIQSDPASDLRTTAFLQPARQTLEVAGLWSRLSEYAAPLQIMRIVDAGGETSEPRLIKDFDAAEISEQPFGWNLPNWLLRREILAYIETLPNVEFRAGVATKSLVTREAEALVGLSDGSRYTARLVIGADGRGSPVRELLEIGVKTIRYGQKALAFSVEHPLEHHNISTEVHRSGGPFTLVPLPSRESRHFSAVVWMHEGPEIERLAALPEPEFEAEMTARSGHILGPLKLATRRSKWPIISQIADRMTGQRTALMAEAAHVMPPIGAQGLNMSLGDLRVLRELCLVDPENIGSAQMLDKYDKTRHREAKIRVTGVDLLNRASMLGAQGLRDLRAEMLNGLYTVAPVRKGLMRAGLGAR